jgi:hypothetical protein
MKATVKAVKKMKLIKKQKIVLDMLLEPEIHCKMIEIKIMIEAKTLGMRYLHLNMENCKR